MEEGKALFQAVEEEIEYMFRDGIFEDLCTELEIPVEDLEILYVFNKSGLITRICEKVNFHDVVFQVFREHEGIKVGTNNSVKGQMSEGKGGRANGDCSIEA